MHTRAGVGLGLLVLLSSGCGSGGEVRSRLQPLASCSEVEAAVREAALQDMNATLEENARRALSGDSCYAYEDAMGAPTAMPAPAPAGSRSSGGGGGASQTSTTNNQVVGVDEADFIKNDNRHIYMVSAGAFRIIEAWPAASAREIARLPIEGTPRKLFVEGNRALIYSSLPRTSSSDLGSTESYGGGWQECTYGYSCNFTGDGNPTKISIVDLSDRTAPKLIRELKSSASYLNARRIGAAVHTVLTAPGPVFKGLATWPEKVSRCGNTDLGATQLAFETLRRENTRIIQSTPLSELLPRLTDTRIVGDQTFSGANLLGTCQGFYKPGRADGSSFTSILSLQLDSSATPVVSTIVSRPGAVYASAEALYMAVPERAEVQDSWYSSSRTETEATIVHRFDLRSPASSVYFGSGLVKGRVLNQFAMDEWQGDLRIATTTGHLPSPEVHSTLSVLRPRGGGLATIGVLDQLAPKEDIRSVRFDGQRGYVVTFKKTDPLFVLDLGNAFGPRVLAELKIPGFSTYMHMMDERHLLTVGYDAADQGDFAWFTGVRLQIFDVSSPTNPRLAHFEVIGTRGSSSEALTNHLAFTYFAPKELLALPMTICEGGTEGGSYGTEMTFSGLMVYRVTPTAGFTLRGQVDHGSQGASCHNWWTNASSTVKRSIVMDDFVYSVSETQIKVNHLDNLGADLVVIPVGT